MRRPQNADIHTLKTASAVPIHFPCLLQFYTGYRIWHAYRVWKRKTSEKRWFTRSWKYPNAATTFSLFLDEFLETDLRPINCSLTTSTKRVHPAAPTKRFGNCLSAPLLLFLFLQAESDGSHSIRWYPRRFSRNVHLFLGQWFPPFLSATFRTRQSSRF